MAGKSLVKSAAILAVAGIIVKVLGAFFRIPLTNMIGATGMANYSPAYYMYSILLVISISGIPIAISKMVSERCALGEYREAERVFKISRLLMAAIGFVSFIVLFFFAEYIANVIHIPGSALSMRMTAPALFIVPIMAAYRGYFQGMQDMVPTAVSQVIEQVFRVGIGLALAVILMRGTLFAETYDEGARGAAGGCFGATAGAIGGIATVLLIYFMRRRQIKTDIRNDATDVHETGGHILKTIVWIAIPITIGATIMPLVNLIDATIVTIRLEAAGFAGEVVNDLYGQLTAMAEPIVAFPQVLMTAIVMSIVPMVSAANRKRDHVEMEHTISTGFKLASVLAFPCAIGLTVLSKPSLLLLYPLQVESAISATPCLQVLSLAFVFLSYITIMNGMLQGVGRQTWPVINLAIGVAVKIVVTYILVSIPSINVVGAAIGTMCTYIVAAALDYVCVVKFIDVRIKWKEIVVKPLIASLIMGVFTLGAYELCMKLSGHNSIATLLAIIVGVIVYGILIIKIKGITREEMLEISFGSKIVRVCDKLKLW